MKRNNTNEYSKEGQSIKVYTLSELEPILGFKKRTIYNYVRDGRLKAIKVGNQWRVSEDNLKKFVNGDN